MNVQDEIIEIKIANDFSDTPALRTCDLSDYSGEEFYHKIMNKAFKEAYDNNKKLIINLDYVAGYASSFLDEAFGKLVYDFTLNIVKPNIEIISKQEPHWIKMIYDETFPQWEERRKNNKPPKITGKHEPWFRYLNNKFILVNGYPSM